ncbi:MAG: hypothetical protein RMM06_04400 [Armatimonadota bacterium]|nr:hypothetical protein [bacterium]MCS7308624.1 hypothetical protein [Armatimonadota bacterium]MDW8103948.1 hypothetical protein [Armatimonadota bacterium]MDW8289938.1 hypothetical protein [Armatimonadota bacterium]
MLQATDLIGRRVMVWSRSGTTEHRDEGVLRALAPQWIIIENEKGELMMFPTVAVRLVKVLPESSGTSR